MRIVEVALEVGEVHHATVTAARRFQFRVGKRRVPNHFDLEHGPLTERSVECVACAACDHVDSLCPRDRHGVPTGCTADT